MGDGRAPCTAGHGLADLVLALEVLEDDAYHLSGNHHARTVDVRNTDEWRDGDLEGLAFRFDSCPRLEDAVTVGVLEHRGSDAVDEKRHLLVFNTVSVAGIHDQVERERILHRVGRVAACVELPDDLISRGNSSEPCLVHDSPSSLCIGWVVVYYHIIFLTKNQPYETVDSFYG